MGAVIRRNIGYLEDFGFKTDLNGKGLMKAD